MVKLPRQGSHHSRRRDLDAYIRPWWYKDGREAGSCSAKALHGVPSDTFSYESMKAMHGSMSEYWKDALQSHWPVLIQGLFLVTAILVFGPWIGHGCSDEMTNVDNVPPDTWWMTLTRLKDLFTIKEFGTKYFKSCYEQHADGGNFKRKANILKRRRVPIKVT